MIHELGHAYGSSHGGYTALYEDMYAGKDGRADRYLRRDNPAVAGNSYGFASGFNYLVYQMSDNPITAYTEQEVFADMFLGWATNTWYDGSFNIGWGSDGDAAMQAMYATMADHKSAWINEFMGK